MHTSKQKTNEFIPIDSAVQEDFTEEKSTFSNRRSTSGESIRKPGNKAVHISFLKLTENKKLKIFSHSLKVLNCPVHGN